MRYRVRPSTAWSLQNPRFGLQLRHQLSDVLDLDATLAARRFGGLENLKARRQIDTIVRRALVGDRLFLDFDGLQPAIDFARHLEVGTVDLKFGGKRRLRPPEQGCQHLSGLV